MKPQVLTIAGSDSGGGAGIQADLKTITMHNAYGLSVITALTAQNTLGVQGVFPISGAFVDKQLHSVFSDFSIRAVKIGMVHNSETALIIARYLSLYKPGWVILDPVMVATSGDTLITENTIETIVESLFPLAHLITPNKQETELLTGYKSLKTEDFAEAASRIQQTGGASILIKGGDLIDETATDYLLESSGVGHQFSTPRIATTNTHGTGCTLSSAIACRLAEGKSMVRAVEQAREYVQEALRNNIGEAPGKGNGPVDHNFLFNGRRL